MSSKNNEVVLKTFSTVVASVFLRPRVESDEVQKAGKKWGSVCSNLTESVTAEIT